MESIISEILDRLRAGEELDAKALLRILNDHNKRLDANAPHYSKKKLLPFYLRTKPWKCGGACIYCPNDLRMPKSYLSDEPACQRAERNYFDPYLQVTSRLRALNQMGHVTDKIELIVLGGTWSDYPRAYQIWFITELFRALNDADDKLPEGDKPVVRHLLRRRTPVNAASSIAIAG